jgi:hypothetical protein
VAVAKSIAYVGHNADGSNMLVSLIPPQRKKMISMYRSDVVGSLLRPDYLRQARAKRQSGVIPETEFKRLEDRAVREAIALQTEAGLDVSIRIIDEGRIVSSISN